MKIPRILVLITFVLLLGCAKEEAGGITRFTGNDIDSVVRYSLNNSLDTIAVFAKKFTYSVDKKTTTEQWYETIEGQENLVPTIFKSYNLNDYKLIEKVGYLNDTTTFEYKFNSNLFVISFTKHSNISTEYDSTFYHYDDNNYLYSIKSIHLNNSGELPYRSVSNYYYQWENGNLTMIVFKETVNGTLIYQSTTNYQYGDLKNPLSYFYYGYFENPKLRYGRASKNLINLEESKNRGNVIYSTSYSYLLYPNTKSLLEKSYRENYQSLTKIFYK